MNKAFYRYKAQDNQYFQRPSFYPIRKARKEGKSEREKTAENLILEVMQAWNIP